MSDQRQALSTLPLGKEPSALMGYEALDLLLNRKVPTVDSVRLRLAAPLFDELET
jgi:hypothetical protein